jgi:molybdenum cofactor guanylyltransferase
VTEFSGIVLAGGKSSRFGSDKARFLYQGKPIMQWVLDSFEQADERFIVANQPYNEFKLPVYADIIQSQTPLSGIHSALVHAKYDWIGVAACDMPFLTTGYWKRLKIYCTNTQAVVIESEVGLEPLAAFYHKDLLPEIEACLQKNQKAIHVFLQSINTTVLKASELAVPVNTFYNINRLEDVEGMRFQISEKKSLPKPETPNPKPSV